MRRRPRPRPRLIGGTHGLRSPRVISTLLAAVVVTGPTGCGSGTTPAKRSSAPASAPQNTTTQAPPATSTPAASTQPSTLPPATRGTPRPARRTALSDRGATLSTTAQGGAAPGQIVHGPRTRRLIALTFDADMTHAMLRELHDGRVPSWYNAQLFDELRATRTPATIFLTGLWARTYSGIVRGLASDPLFELANHTLDHSAFASPCFGLPVVPPDQKRSEVIRARNIIEGITGMAPHYFRFPGGCATAADVRLVRSLGEQPVLWDVVSGDAFQSDPAVIVHAVSQGVRPGSVIVAHCMGGPNAPATAAAMAELIPRLKARGYRFVTLGRLLNAPS